MSEREHERLPPVSQAAAEPGLEKPHQRVPSLVGLAFQERDGAEQKRIVHELIDALIAMRAPGDEAEEAATLVAHLDAKALKGLVDQDGRVAHAEAVETLLSLGFPHALKVSPEDLREMRDTQSLGGRVLSRAQRRMYGTLAAEATVAAGAAYGLLLASPEATPWALSSAAFGLAGGTALWALKDRETVGLPTALLTLSSVAALVGGFIDLPLFLVAAGMFFATALGRSSDDK